MDRIQHLQQIQKLKSLELQLQAAIKKETSPSNHINYLKEQIKALK